MSDGGVLCEGGDRGSIDSSEEFAIAASRVSVGSKVDGKEGVMSINSGYLDLWACKL